VNIETLNWPEPYGKCNREEWRGLEDMNHLGL
jgi:hypothetical protein